MLTPEPACRLCLMPLPPHRRARIRLSAARYPRPSLEVCLRKGQPGNCCLMSPRPVAPKLKTGIERVARALTLAFLERPPDGFRVEPVYLSNEGGAWHYRYARRFTLDLLGCPPDALADDAVESQAGDLLLGLR